MAQHTEKEDWFNDFLSKDSEMLVSSHKSASAKFGLRESETVEVRFIGNRSQTHLYLVTVSAPKENWGRVQETLCSSERANDTLNRLKSLLTPPHVIVLLYDEDSRTDFSASSDLSGFKNMDSDQLQEDFAEIKGSLVDDVGVQKEVNKSINDSFQWWTRSYLTKYVTVNDFDALRLGDNPTIYELKRVQEDVEEWCAYVDDETNYAALMHISQRQDIPLHTVSYQEDREEIVGFHWVESTEKKNTSNCQGSITAQRYICNPQDIFETFPEGQRDVVERYRSTRFRSPARCRHHGGCMIIGWE